MSGGISLANSFLLPSHMIIANGPNTYAPSVQHFTEASSFDQLAATSHGSLVNDDRFKKSLKFKNDGKKLMTPKRAKKVVQNRGIMIAYSKEKKAS
jgi:hypothetical protein